jgi:hypothetical protein
MRRWNAGVMLIGLIVGAVLLQSAAPVLVLAQGVTGEHRDGKRRICSVRSLRGTFSVQASGTIVTPPPGSGIPAGPFATVGTLRVDEDGNALLDATRSFNGTIIKEVELPGVITLGESCSGSAEFQGGRRFDLVVFDDFNEMAWIQTNPGTVVTVQMKRQ